MSPPKCDVNLTKVTKSASAILFLLILSAQSLAQTIETERIASGLTAPILVTAPPGNLSRIVVVQQDGRVIIIEEDVVLGTPFLDISADVLHLDEQGLLGLAFHPNYAVNGFFYVNYIESGSGDTVIERYTVSANPNVADGGSAFEILRYAQPFANHNGGHIAFGPNDGYLYIASGDGGSFNDPLDSGQTMNTMLGKILRIDVDGGSPYAIPASNPFVGVGGALDEIWSYGLRNPWRFSFDRANGDMYIGDVGQGEFEEVSFQPGASIGGENYGWRIAEGFECLGGGGTCGTNPGFTPPIHAYAHTEGRSITGGYVYRGSAIASLQGTYFFADFSFSRIWSFDYDGATVSNFAERTADLTPYNGGAVNSIASFGEDGAGEIYICDHFGEIFRIVSDDKDGDGLTNSAELGLGTDPDDADTDNDFLNDGDEVNVYGTDVFNFDTDGDGFNDGLEALNGSDPLSAASVPSLPVSSPAALLLGIGAILIAGFAGLAVRLRARA